MQGRFGSWARVLFAVLLIALVSPAFAAGPGLLEDTDLPGSDYSVLKGTSLDACQAACQTDRICRAFTFNRKAGWCFLKGTAGTPKPFAGAVSGRIPGPTVEAVAANRQADLPFPAQGLLEDARRLAAELPKTDPAPKGATYADLVADADGALAKGNAAGAVTAYRQALGINGNDPAVWLGLARAALRQSAAEARRRGGGNSADLAAMASSAALAGFLRTQLHSERAEALGVLADALVAREMWREAIATYRASLGLVADSELERKLDRVVAEHGFRVVSNEIDAESASPRICAVFSDPLPTGDGNLSAFVSVDAPGAAIETQYNQICVEGVEHGKRYHLRLRAGLPSAQGEKLRKDVDLSLYVPDRKPFVGFAGNAYVMPQGLGGGLPISSVNADKADLVIYRIGDRAIAAAIRSGVFLGTLTPGSAEDIAENSGAKVWEGQVDLARGAANAVTVTAIPIGEAVPKLEAGAYVATAKVAGSDQNYWSDMATQWFIVTDLGLTAVTGDDGLHAFVRSLESAAPVASAKVRLVARNNDVLGETTTDAAGRADFAPGLTRGEGGKAPQLLVAETADGDYAFLDMGKAAFDLTDRGVEGRPAPGPLDVFATTERGVYRPGETVYLTALVRDAHARAVTGLPLTLELQRPDGVVDTHQVLKDQGAGGYFATLPLLAGAMRGSWHLKLYVDPEAAPLANVNFLVEDFEPERLAFEASAPQGPVAAGEPTEIAIAARYLYGATAPDLPVQADVVLRPVTTLAGYPGFTFGRLDDPIETDRESLGVVGTTDAEGKTTAEVTVPEPQPTTRPIEARIILDLVDTNGRPVERTLTRPLKAAGDRIGVKPLFRPEDGLAQGSEAQFAVIAVSPDGKTVEKPGLAWTLSRVETTYQWYREGSTWKWEPITTTRKVANGTVDAAATGPVTVSARVDWGRYRFEVESSGPEATSTSYEFDAGYFYTEAGSDTPDRLRVALDKQAYRPGETAHLKLEPQFAGTALVMVLDDRIVSMQAVDVPEGGTTVDLPVTDQWGPGAYVTAMLYRPASAAEKRMPARALGLAYADVDPGSMKLDVSLTAPHEARPRQSFSAEVQLGDRAAGEKAYVTVAAVDLGILNLTNFKAPDPEGWYFGQRRLGVEIRDLYGQLIDPMQGQPGALRSGGDAGAARLGTPPATSVLVALSSGVVEVGQDGVARVDFAMPDFNGTVRLMAVAWTAEAVGHASADVVVHDPVVVNLSPPRFLRLGDKSRVLVEIDNVSGPAGSYRVSFDGGDGLKVDETTLSADLAAGARTALTLPITATALGDHEAEITIVGPTGDALVKTLTLGVRPQNALVTRSETVPLAPGASVELGADRFAGLVAGTGILTLSIGPAARLDVPELLMALDRYPYGCAEQVTSRALPLLYLNEVAGLLGLATDEDLRNRVTDAIADLLAKQNSAGSFGLWGPFDAGDLWLDAYVTDFLLRAKAEGHVVRAEALDMALDNLANGVASAADFSNGGEDIAYALYDLARAGRAAIGDLRYYEEARLDHFGSPLAKAQIGAALALYGDRARASEAFAAAVAGLAAPEDTNAYRTDYGSRLRDAAAILALASEFTPTGVDLSALAKRVADLRDVAKWTSTQDDAWTLVAASALVRQAASGRVTIAGEPVTGTAFRRFEESRLKANPVTVVNTANRPTEIQIAVEGLPASAPPAGGNGFTIERSYYLPDGTEFDPETDPIEQNDRFVVVLSVTSTALGSGQYLVADPLPAGFEIENPDLTAGEGVNNFAWLEVDTPVHAEARTDQYVAAFRYTELTKSFSTAYLVRAVSPGSFTLPGATVEDMYRPALRANTAAGHIDISATGP